MFFKDFFNKLRKSDLKYPFAWLPNFLFFSAAIIRKRISTVADLDKKIEQVYFRSLDECWEQKGN